MTGLLQAEEYDLVIRDGRAMDPEISLDAVRHVGIRKGRLQVGAHAVLIVFDPKAVRDRSTFAEANQSSTGFRYLLVQGTPVVSESKLLENTFPGQGLRAPAK